MKLNFTKLQGTGNDFIVLADLQRKIKDYHKLAQIICKRHFGVGGDGLIVVLPATSPKLDFKMRIFNPDGSEAEMCGNGIRCFAQYIRDKGLSRKKVLQIETLAGVIKTSINFQPLESLVTVNMGQPRFKTEEIPLKLNFSADYLQNYSIRVMGQELHINCVSMGNPHTIIFMDSLANLPLAAWGKEIESLAIFPEKTNVEFVEIINPQEIKMKVWERGAGLTLACGTGASAAVVAGIKNGYLAEKVKVHLPGGELNIQWSGGDVFLTGRARKVFTGEIHLEEELL